MAAQFGGFGSGRTKLSFVKTQVLTSSDGGATFDTENNVAAASAQLQGGDEVLQRRDYEKLNARLAQRTAEGTSLSLFEQLQKNKEAKGRENPVFRSFPQYVRYAFAGAPLPTLAAYA